MAANVVSVAGGENHNFRHGPLPQFARWPASCLGDRMLPDTGLLYFYEVVRHGSVRHAAEHLHISASAISRMVKKVEHRFHASLFERRSDGMVLTPAGEVLARHLA
ncbi:MAG: LysR family transcriptional regulator, partial [Comamonadaceae bacterium]